MILSTLARAFFLYKTGNKTADKKLYYSAIYLFSKQSFRLPQSAKKDLFIIFKTYFTVLKDIFTKKPDIKKVSEGNVGVFDSSYNAQEMRIEYLKHFGVSGNYFISRENLSGSLNVVMDLLRNSFLYFLICGFFFSRRRVNYALLLRETLEWRNLILLLKKNNITKLYHFCIYEKDANMLSHILAKHNIQTVKITSEVPLTFANKIIVADEIKLCFGYQNEEVKAFKDTIFSDKIETWMPEMQMNYRDKYEVKTELPQNSIGFYSSAFWLRKKLNHSVADVGSYDAEEELLNFVADYLKQNTEVKLILFTHPYEKRSEELFTQTKQHYLKIFGADLMPRIELTNTKERSTDAFDKVNIGISVFSTIMFERISMGFKTILAPLDTKNFPLTGSPFRNICAYTREELFSKLDKNLPLSNDEFFEVNEIKSYVK